MKCARVLIETNLSVCIFKLTTIVIKLLNLYFMMGPKKLLGLYDLWTNEKDSNVAVSKNKTHPSKKRNLKAPLPHPGQSYNPDPEDHQRLLKKIAQVELKHQKKQASINRDSRVRVTEKQLLAHEKEELESGIKHLLKPAISDKKQASKQMKQGDNDDEDSGSSTDSAYSEYDEKDFEAILSEKKVEMKRKTKRQRLAQLKDKLQRKAAKLRKAKNVRLSKFDAIKKIIKEVEKKEKEEAAKHKRRSRKVKKERLGTRFEQSDPMYCLSSELPSSLRETKCSMDAIVREQLESFQSRLMVEPTNFQIKKRKYKKKSYDRHANDGEINVGPIDYAE